ncbi:MAG: thioredoxin domain-containing protein [Deltaproteobacteria bacterium]|nr:thioredoxin domain-containing protein [Deltaproteobacteria bacterium]
MTETSSRPLQALAAVVILAALAVAGFALLTLSKEPVSGTPAPPVPPAAPAAAPAAVPVPVPVYVVDGDRLAESLAAAVAARAAERLRTELPGLAMPAPPPEPPVAAPAPAAVVAAPPAPEAPEASAAPPASRGSAGAWTTAFGDHPALGPEDAPVLVFILSDFQCPVCRRAAEGLAPLLTRFPEVRWIFWNNPLDMHRRARPAARAAMAAFRQGKFWEYHDAIFAASQDLEDADLERRAADLALDLERFRRDLADPALDVLFDGGMQVAALLAARGTPAFVINGRVQVGWGSAAGIQSMVEDEIEAARGLLAQGRTVAQVREERARTNAREAPHGEAYVAHMLRGEVPPAPVE